jgi:predicted nucleic acid-binding protein
MTLVDTSAWVEYLRATGSATHLAVRSLVAEERTVHTTEPVVLEVLAGGRDEDHARQLRRLLWRCDFLPPVRLDDHEEAARVYRRCRRAGATIRSTTDCLIAAVAIRAGVPVLAVDRDFARIAQHSDLVLANR